MGSGRQEDRAHLGVSRVEFSISKSTQFSGHWKLRLCHQVGLSSGKSDPGSGKQNYKPIKMKLNEGNGKNPTVKV